MSNHADQPACDPPSDDYQQLEEDHLRIKTYLEALSGVCVNLNNHLKCDSCAKTRHASCDGLLPSFLYDAIDIIGSHFQREESLMGAYPSDAIMPADLLNHHKAHANILKTLENVASDCMKMSEEGKTDDAYRKLCNDLTVLFKEHEKCFDERLMQSINRRENL